MTEPVLSIIVPSYNIGEYITRCLDSIFAQATDDIEVIIVDDCSTDDTRDIILRYIKDIPYATCICKEKNEGPSAARNSGLKAARGKYVWFVDGDDIINEGAIPHFLTARSKCRDCEIFFFDILDNDLLASYDLADATSISGYEYSRRTPLHYAWAFIYSHDFLRKYQLTFWTIRNIEDFHFNMRAHYYAENMFYIAKPMYTYINRPGSISTERSAGHLLLLSDESLRCLANLKGFIDTENAPEEQKKLFLQHLSHSVNGLLFSWLRFPYQADYIKKCLDVLRESRLYPTIRNFNRKSNLFACLSNKPSLFLLICCINRRLKIIC